MPDDREAWGIVEGDTMPLDPDRWAEERQYLRHNTEAALAALRSRPDESLALLRRLTLAQAKGLPGRVVAKLEMRNACGRVKDRLGVALIENAEGQGVLRPGMTLVGVDPPWRPPDAGSCRRDRRPRHDLADL